MTMRNLSRNKVLTVAAFLLLSVTTYLTACKKFLDKKPLGAYTTDNYPYPPGSGRYDQFVFIASSLLISAPING